MGGRSQSEASSRIIEQLQSRVTKLENSLAKCLVHQEANDRTVSDLQTHNIEVTTSLEFVYNDIVKIKENSVANTDLLEKLQRIEDHCNVTRNRVNVLDNKSRNKNIRIINIKESDSENQEQLRVKIDKIIQHTGIKCCSTNAFRIGEPRPLAGGTVPSKPRPIIATLPSEEDRNNVLRSAYKLKSLQKGIFVQDDVCQDTVMERQNQMIRFKELKSRYQTVYFRGSRLKYKGRKDHLHHQPGSHKSNLSNPKQQVRNTSKTSETHHQQQQQLDPHHSNCSVNSNVKTKTNSGVVSSSSSSINSIQTSDVINRPSHDQPVQKTGKKSPEQQRQYDSRVKQSNDCNQKVHHSKESCSPTVTAAKAIGVASASAGPVQGQYSAACASGSTLSTQPQQPRKSPRNHDRPTTATYGEAELP